MFQLCPLTRRSHGLRELLGYSGVGLDLRGLELLLSRLELGGEATGSAHLNSRSLATFATRGSSTASTVLVQSLQDDWAHLAI
jgi:hypothetical protein